MIFHILFMLEPLFLFRLLFLYFYGFSILLSWKVCNISYCGHFIKQYLTFCFDVMTCFSLISRWCSFIRRLTILPVSLIYLPTGTREYFCVPERRSLILRISYELSYLFKWFKDSSDIVFV